MLDSEVICRYNLGNQLSFQPGEKSRLATPLGCFDLEDKADSSLALFLVSCKSLIW